MKIPTSSSILLATLAISSSSSCLAAPAGDAPQDTGLTTSSSTSHMSSMPIASAAPGFRSDDTTWQKVRGDCRKVNLFIESGGPRRFACFLCDPIGRGSPPPVGPTLSKVLGALLRGGSVGTQSVDSDSTASAQGVDPQDMKALQAAVAEAMRSIAGSVPGVAGSAVGNVSPSAPALAQRDDTNAGSGSSTSASSTQTAQAADGAPANSTSTTASSSASAAPPSPPMPGNPPNTPVNASALPVGTPV
ncbi:hypothetical protein BDZ97DRAFT_1764119 [Flammula alnicola]|nr:hypothetical protein BDZ97DRAFT_1764119 [Flammula alnicola]